MIAGLDVLFTDELLELTIEGSETPAVRLVERPCSWSASVAAESADGSVGFPFRWLRRTP